MKRAICALIAAALISTACSPPQEFVPDPDRFWKMLVATINNAYNTVFGTSPDNTSIDCAVVLFDQSIRSADRRGQFTPVHTPNNIYVWWTACLGAQHGHHVVPTFRASGYPNSPQSDPTKRAACWAVTPVPDGDMIFDCYFDNDPHYAWVVDLQNNRWGELAVAA
jgi:hypothetical protein